MPPVVAGQEAQPLGDASNHEKERVDATTDATTMLLTPPPSSPHQHVGGGGSGGDCCCGVVQFLSPSRIPLPAGAPDKTLPAAINRRGIFSRINSGEVAPVRDARPVFRSTLEWSQARSPRAPPLASSCFSASSDEPPSATSVADASLPSPPPLPPRDGVSMRYKATASPPPPAAAPPRTPTSLLRRRLLVRAKPDLPSYLKFCSSPSASDSGSESAHLITPSASRDSSRDNLAEDEEASTASNPRRNTLERLQRFRWGGGGDKSKKSDSGENKRKQPRSSDKTESLRELTQKLKAHSVSPERKKANAAAAAAAAAAAFSRDLSPPPSLHADPSVISGPQAPPQTSVGVARKDAANKEAAAGCEEDAGGGAAPAVTAIVGGGGNVHAVPGKDAASVENSICETAAMDSLRSCSKDLSAVIKEEDIFECENLRLPKPESRTIVGSYIQRTIPIRSASFSQVDFSPADGKYIHSSAKTSPFAALTTAAVKSGLPLSNTSVITGGSLTLPRKRLPDISGSQTVSPSSSTAIGMEEPTGSTPSVDSAVGSDEGFVTADLSKIPIAKSSGSADAGSDASHKPSGARSLTYPLHRRGSHSDENIPYSSIDGNGLKSLYGAVVRELPEVLEESEPSASDSAAPGDTGDMRPSSSAQATDCSADFCAPDTVSLCEPSSTPPPRFYVGDDLEDAAKCVNTECTTNNLSANESVTRELADNARDEVQDGKAMKDTDGAVFRKSNSSDEEPLLSEQIDSDGWLDSMGGKDEKDKKSTQGRRSSGENDNDNDVYITRWPATEITNSSQNNSEFVEKADIEVPEETKKDRGPSICAQQESNDQWAGEQSAEKVSNARSGDDSPRWSGEGEGDRSEWGSVPDEANSPDESRPRRPQWMPRASPRHVWPDRPRLVWQSSDEKDDEPSSIRPSPRRYHPLPRADSFSEGESDQGDRYPPASFREHTSSPSFFGPSDVSDSESRGGTEMRSLHTPRRYSKRPLRGPYGQMLEAEMKKPETTRIFSKDDLKFLEEFVTPPPQQQPENPRDKQTARPASADPHDGGNLVRPRALTTLSLDDSQLKGGYGRTGRSATTPPSPQPRTSPKRKVSANIPYASPDPSSGGERTLVSHHRTTSSPSQLEGYARKAERQTAGNGVAPRAVPEPTPELLAALLQGSSERLLEVDAVTSPPSTPTLPASPAPNGTCAAPQVTSTSSATATAATTTTVPTTAVTPNGNAVQHWKDTRTHVAVELLETERTYVESLQILVTKYLKPLKSPENAGLVDASLVDEIFYQVPAILSHHEVFLDQLKKRLDNWDVRQTVGDVFLDAFTKQTVIETYTSFINNWKTAKEVLKNTAQSKPAFAKFLEAMTREHKGKLSLDCLLIMPVQRIPRYELLIQTLVKHTDTTHPDYQLLLEAQREVHDLSLKINSTERETLKELEALIEGLINLVSPERAFLRHDLVTMASGQGTRKERALFLFSDLLVITSIKRRSATIRKPSTSCPGSLASTLEANKYKLLMRIPLDELEIIKAKDENVRRILREIEHLVEDVATLNQMSELVSTLHCPHSTLEDLVRDTLSTLNKQLTERQNCDSQLSYLELSLSPQSGPENNISVVFTKPDKKNSWEETFNEAKQKLALSADRRPVPEFLSPVPIRKTRAGLQFTCAAPTLGFNAFNMRDVWVCNSDGYVGQVCVLSLQPEPNVVSCNGVCNARILCIASIPAGVAGISSGNSCSSAPFTNSKPGISISVEDTDDGGGNIQLDSSSSDDDDDGDEGSSGGPGTEEEQKRIRSASDSMTSDSGLVSDDTDSLQPTMWLGTEDGCIHVYNCSDNIRIKKNKVKIQHGSSVHCIIYLDNRVFVSLANGDITVYVRDYSGGWNTSDPFAVSVGSAAMPVTRMLPIMGKLWCACHNYIKIINTISLEVESTFLVNNENTRAVTNMAASGFGVWISLQNSATIRLFHAVTHEILCDINVAPPVTKMLASCDDIIRQHKAACLRITSLLACKDLLWIGTSAGVILTMPLPHVSASTTKLTNIPTPTGVPHGHTGHVRFLTCVETNPSSSTDSIDVRRSTHHRFSLKNKPDLIAHQGSSSSGAKLLVISGGDGYEDFRVSSVSEVVGREDATNHLLLWNV